jgi:2-polyprenyl-6-hydroxyphenyl methylase/3-demethylubiquinone-9 3-methyltransferase
MAMGAVGFAWHTIEMTTSDDPRFAPHYREPQLGSAGNSCPEIHAAAVRSARPEYALRWLDIGCGTGTVLRELRDKYHPAQLTAVDVIDWLDDDLRDGVDLVIGPAENALNGVEAADRVLLIEVLEHLEAPWTVLRAAAHKVAPGGRLVLTTPNVASLRHRLELLVRGELTSFRPNNQPHITPALPHVIGRVLADEGLRVRRAYAGVDIVPLTGGLRWPVSLQRRAIRLASVSLLVTADRLCGGLPVGRGRP